MSTLLRAGPVLVLALLAALALEPQVASTARAGEKALGPDPKEVQAVLDKAIAAMNYMTRYPWFVKHMLERNAVFYPFRALVQVLRRVGIVEGG